MIDVIDFQEALKRTEDRERTLLIGNGFSSEYFSYRNLLDKSGLEPGMSLRDLFTALDTVDFEAVVRALEGAVQVEHAYGNAAHAEELEADAQKVREALVTAVNTTHPTHRQDLALKYESSATFLANFASVFTLNYDLLLYWVNLERVKLRDGFAFGRQIGSMRGPFSESADCHLFNLHGGLHLFQDSRGEMMKAFDRGDGVIATITKAISVSRRFPVYVAEGTSGQKVRKINSVPYLRHCYDKLRENEAAVFVYGHSADQNDVHIYRAIFMSGAAHLYFGVYQPDEEKLKKLDGLLAGYKHGFASTIDYTFFDSGSARVWDA